MSNGLYPCTAADPMGVGPQNGLLGDGALPWPRDVAARAFPSTIDIAGTYAVDDVSATEFLIAELSAPETELNEQETEEYTVLLHSLLGKISTAGNISSEQLLTLQEKAKSVPYIGNLLFSNANLPGTLASVGGTLHSASKATKVENLLDLTDATRKKLKRWAATRGKPGSVSANRAFRGRIKIIRLSGNLYFEVPTNARANMYRVSGAPVGAFAHLPVYNTASALRAKAHIDSNVYGQRGVGKLLAGRAAGPVLAFVPQLYFDAKDATGFEDFINKSAYSQPTNALAFAGGLMVGAFIGGTTAVVMIPVGLAVGVWVQLFMSDEVSGLGTSLGNYLTGKE
ncbi:hypothetical protein [Pseudomonas sp. UM16]|uniref:hypothetical protein n=1 Tax=Pseudomonas sp. UM16 TaxID=3158962 RepID=UPI00398FD31E